jgi:hypothetical protein
MQKRGSTLQLHDPAKMPLSRTAMKAEEPVLWCDLDAGFKQQLRRLDVETAIFDHDTTWTADT